MRFQSDFLRYEGQRPKTVPSTVTNWPSWCGDGSSDLKSRTINLEACPSGQVDREVTNIPVTWKGYRLPPTNSVP